MNYFVTGGTGFVGRFLLERLLKREGTVYVLTRAASLHKLDALRQRLSVDEDRLVGVVGDLTLPCLGMSDIDIARLRGTIKYFFHVAAIYDLKADEASQHAANVDGTQYAVDCAEALQAACFQYVSSVAVSGMYKGTFREDMFEEAENLANAYYRTKHDAEAVVRRACGIPWRIYRPSGVIGHSETGEIDKIDGPYYSFPLLKKLRSLPRWLPLPGVAAGRLNLVPVDYVVDALDYIAHKPGLDGGCFHLTNTRQYDVTEMTNLFAAAANASQLSVRSRINPAAMPWRWLLAKKSVQNLGTRLVESLGMPVDALRMMEWDTRYDSASTQAALADSGIILPSLEDYADTIWRYWEQHLDPAKSSA